MVGDGGSSFLHMQTDCFCWKIWTSKTPDLEFKTGNRVEYNNFNYMGEHMTNRCSILAVAHVNLENSGRRRDAFTMAVN